MSGTDSNLFTTAMKLAQEAVQLDNAKENAKASEKYLQAAEVLNDYIKFCKNPKLRDLAQDKAKQYISRARILSNMKENKQKVSVGGPSNKTTKTGKSPESDKPSDDSIPPEEKELRDTISGTVMTEKPTVTWADVAGMEDAKQALRESVVLPLMHPELFQGARKPWQGILLFGPPGCGKTLLAKAAANECTSTFFAVDSASIISKWLGESEKLMKTLFQVAYLDAPSLIFIDEIDSIAGKRGEGNEGGGERRIKTQLLQEMQGVKSKKDKLITLLGATNRPWDIDSAVLRRFEKKIYIGLPSEDGRRQIFELSTKDVDKDETVNFEELAAMTEGYTGSDIATVCREVVMLPIRELDVAGSLDEGNEDIQVRSITQEDFMSTVQKIKPVVSQKELDNFMKWKDEFGG
jgi:vacuolar protein-sorting-associated protein 4